VWSIDSCEDISEESSLKPYIHKSLPFSHVKINIKKNDLSKSPKQVDLKLTRRSLANENLPVWIVNGVIDANNLRDEDFNALQRNYEVMKHVGKFSFYQQPETSSAAVYFHERREFDGMIDNRVIIRGLSDMFINHDGIINLELDSYGVYIQPNVRKHTLEELEIPPGPDSGVNKPNLRTYKKRVFDGYPEILVVVDWSTAQNWNSNM
ncbi:hypothetical protein PV328_012185, partial [Microctonus aethiopoides]